MAGYLSCVRLTVLFVSLYITYAVALYIFARGFLLTRVSLMDQNTNLPPLKPQYKRAVILIIDALHIDMVREVSENSYYTNQMKHSQNYLRTQPRNAILFRFVADAPTTTMQRVKGLTTGTLPTFIDISSNFQSAGIEEDSWVLSAQKSGIVFAGDDVWDRLFPEAFNRSYFSPGFNVKDLDTVDNGVITNLYPELQKNDWSVLIGHFLGVDHCGHTFGRNHPEMTRKLTQMDDFVHSVIEQLDEETILFVFGDHGMTASGDHGGDSEPEISAAMLVYSKKGLYKETNLVTPPDVSQIDLVPTLSMLLGFPIPYSNLGALIPHMFPPGERHPLLQYNAFQVYNYLRHYVGEENFPRELRRLFDNPGCEGETCEAQGYAIFLEAAREYCVGIWARFDVSAIMLGLLCLMLVIFVHTGAILSPDMFSLPLASGTAAVFGLLTVAVLVDARLFYLLVVALAFSLTMQLGCLLGTSISCPPAALLAVVVINITKFSNSFVITEDRMLLLLLGTLFLTRTQAPLWLPVALVALRCLILFTGCRPELDPCEPNSFTLPLNNLLDTTVTYKNARFVSTAAALVLVTFAFYTQLRQWHVLRSFRGTIHKCYIACAVMCILVHWTITNLPAGTLVPRALVVWPARCVYLAAFSSLVYVMKRPLLVTSEAQKMRIGESPSAVDIVTQLRRNYSAPPVVYGLEHVYSAPLLLALSSFCLLLQLISGDGYSIPLLLHVAVLVALSQVLTAEHSPFELATFFHLISLYVFYSTGHQAVVTSVRWHAAYVGFDSDHDFFIIPGILLMTDTFWGYLLTALAQPLILLRLCSASGDTRRGEAGLDWTRFAEMYRATTLATSLLAATEVFWSCLAAFIHRRHLMVWAIFTPRLFFSVVSFFLPLPVYLFTTALLTRTSSLLHVWLQQPH